MPIRKWPHPRSRRAGAIASPLRPPNARRARLPPVSSWSSTARRRLSCTRAAPKRRYSSRFRRQRQRSHHPSAARATGSIPERCARRLLGGGNSLDLCIRRLDNPCLANLAYLQELRNPSLPFRDLHLARVGVACSPLSRIPV